MRKPHPTYLPSRFETSAKARNEDAKRVALLRSQLVKAPTWLPTDKVNNLADRLASDEAPASMASGRHMRIVRWRFLRKLDRALSIYGDDELVTFTVLNRNWVIPGDQLLDNDLAAITSQFENHLRRVGITGQSGFLLAFLEAEYEPQAGVFTVHFHGVGAANIRPALHRLTPRMGYTKLPSGAVPIKVMAVKNRVRQVAYLLKFWKQRGVSLVGGKTIRGRLPYRIKGAYGAAHLCTLDRHCLNDLTVAIGVWSRRTGGANAMRRLMLLIETISRQQRYLPRGGGQ